MQAHIYILGFVQGVGFRRYVKGKAKTLNLTGWVKNLPDGRVEAVATGDKKNIDALIKYIEKGPFFSEVKSVQVGFEKEETFISFEIIRKS